MLLSFKKFIKLEEYNNLTIITNRRGMVQVLSAITTASTHDPRLNQSITSSGFGNDGFSFLFDEFECVC